MCKMSEKDERTEPSGQKTEKKELRMLQLEKVEENDFELLAGIMKRAFDDDTQMHTPGKEDGPAGYEDGSLLRRLYAETGCTVGKIIWNQETVGGFAVSESDRRGILELLFLDPDRKDRGIGTNAWEKIHSSFPDIRTWYVETPDYSVRNHRFYTEKCGFRFYEKRFCENGAGSFVFIREEAERFQAVVFDMDGLMFDSERVIQKSWDVVGPALGFGKMGKDIYHTLGLNRTERELYFRKTYGEEFPFEEFQERYREEVQKYTKEHGTPVKKGLYELLEVLQRKGIRLAVATSSSYENTVKLLRETDVYRYFQQIVTGNMVERSKPAPDIYRKACEKLGVSPEHALALEDSYNGIRSAHAAGMKVIMVPDLLTDSTCVDDLLYGKMESLLEVAEAFQKNVL